MADLEALLTKTSRTFALAIPELPQPTRHEVTVSYLLFRIADTFEDAVLWSRAEQIEALEELDRLLATPAPDRARQAARAWASTPPLRHEGYLELLEETPAVLDAFFRLRPAARETIRRHLGRTTRGMSRYAGRSGELQLETLEELRDYCHVVAGIVGEMLTELYAIGRPDVEKIAPYLLARARWFGEGLQLVNILKDSEGDAVEGRRYLPRAVPRSKVFELARDDLRQADEYVRALEEAGADGGVIAFNALPVLLAWETLDRVEAKGPGAKLGRGEVLELWSRMHEALANGEPVLARGATRRGHLGATS